MYWSRILSRLDDSVAPSDETQAAREVFAFRLLSVLLLTVNPPPELDEDSFSLRFPDGAIVRLDGLFSHVAALPEDEREAATMAIAERIAPRAPAEVSHDRAEALRHLVLRVVPAAHYPLWALRRAADGLPPTPPFIARYLTDTLSEQLAYELPQTFALLGTNHLEGWDLDRAGAYRAAVDRLRASSPQPFARIGTATFAAQVGDDHDAARIALTDEIGRLATLGEPVALVAHRDTLVITGSEDRAGLARLAAIATEAARKDGLISTQPIALRNGRWEDWLPPEGDPLHEAFTELSIRMQATWYEAQKVQLLRVIEQSGEPRYVAPFGMVRHPETSKVHSYTSFGEGRGYLPEAAMVGVPSPDGDRVAVVDWTVFAELSKDILHPTGFFAPRIWAVDGPPPADNWSSYAERGIIAAA